MTAHSAYPTATHPALVRTGTTLQLTAVPTPSAPTGGLLIAPSFVGVCGTDLQILNGSRPDTAGILGHEAAGVVVQAAPDAPLSTGARVVFNPSAQLTRGRILGHNVSGLFQQYFVVDAQAIEDGLVQPMEAGLPPVCGALVEPVAGIIYAHQLISNIVPNVRSAVVFGAGPIGLIAAEYLRAQGARVLLAHPSQRRLDTAMSLGLLEAGSAMILADDLSERILHWNDAQPLDAALVCTSMAGASVALQHAVEVLRSGACVEMVTNYPLSSATPPGISAQALKAVRAANICGVPEEGAYVHAEISGRRISFTSHRGTSRNHLTLSMRELKRNAQRYTALITHILTMEEAVGTIQTLSNSRSTSINGRDCIKAVVDLTRITPSSSSHTV
jgi:2-epi-valiolone-7-phosphate 1-reductase